MPHSPFSRYQNPHYFKGSISEVGEDEARRVDTTFPLFEFVNWKFYLPRKLQHYHLIDEEFPEFLKGDAILDVGTRTNTLSEMLGKKCQLVDKNNPNLPSWDWEKESLPYQDKTFDTVVCLDTLEHINDFHGSVEDLMRVSKRYVIISLPNVWRKALKPFMRAEGSGAAYGIPPEKPMDRHKWFFNAEDVERFFAYTCGKENAEFKLVRVVHHIPKATSQQKFFYPLLRAVLPERYFKNYFVETVFVVLERRS